MFDAVGNYSAWSCRNFYVEASDVVDPLVSVVLPYKSRGCVR